MPVNCNKKLVLKPTDAARVEKALEMLERHGTDTEQQYALSLLEDLFGRTTDSQGFLSGRKYLTVFDN